MTKLEALKIKEKELTNEYYTGRKELENKVANLFQPFCKNKVEVHIAIYSETKEFCGDIHFIVNKQEVFGCKIEFYYDKHRGYKEPIITKNEFSISYNASFYKKDKNNGAFIDQSIVIGKIWEYEDKFTEILDNFDCKKCYELTNELNKIRDEIKNIHLNKKENEVKDEISYEDFDF